LFAAMRRALVIAGVMLAGLLALAPGLATAASKPPREPELETVEEAENVLFGLTAEGFKVNVYAEDNDGDQTAFLVIARGGLLAEYAVPATITDHSVAAKFGSLGELDFHLSPKRGTRKCSGRLTLTGTFTFTGENGYVHIDADHAEGAFQEPLFTGGCGRPAEAVKFLGRADGIGLEAMVGSRKKADGYGVDVNEWRMRDGTRKETISAYRIEEREGMKVGRGATVSAGPAAFRRDVKAGTALLRPPAPFTGWARLTPGPGGRGVWEGSLQVPTLDGEPIVLAGPDFRVRLYEEEVFDD
jgi:hypothetical protein